MPCGSAVLFGMYLIESKCCLLEENRNQKVEEGKVEEEIASGEIE